MSDTEKPSWEWQQEIQTTVLLYQSRIDVLHQQLEVVTKKLEACIWSITPAMAQAQIDQLNRQLANMTRLYENTVAMLERTNQDLEAQRASTYQAVEREHEAKRQLATARQVVWEEAAKMVEGGRFLHDASPEAKWAYMIAKLCREQANRAQP